MLKGRVFFGGRRFISGLVSVVLVGPLMVLASAQAGSAATVAAIPPGGSYEALTPVRIADTRSGLGGVPKGATRSLVVATAGRAGVPTTGVSAIAVNITVTGGSAPGFVTAYPTGSPRPETSNVNFVRGQTVAQLTVVSVNEAGQFTLEASSPTQLVLDVEGYFTSAGTATTRGLFNPLDPARIMDSRSHLGAGAPGPGGTSVLQVTGRGGVPVTGVSAVVINTTVTRPTTAGYVTGYRTGPTRPATSTINFVPGLTVANRAIVPVSADGRISFYNSAGTTQLVIDVAGYFTDGLVKTTGSYYVPVPVSRVVDTRYWQTSPPTSTRTLRHQQIAGDTCVVSSASRLCGQVLVPATTALTRPVAVLLNITAVPRGPSGYLTVFPAGSATPPSSDVNFAGTAEVSNLAFVKLGLQGAISVQDGGEDANVAMDTGEAAKVVQDLSGYFALPAATPTPAGVWMAQNYGRPQLSVHARTNMLSGVLAVIPSRPWTYALKADGTVWRWDRSPADTATADTSTSLEQVDSTNLHDITAIADAQYFGLGDIYALRSDGTVWGWGYRTTGSAVTFAVLQVPGLSHVVSIGAADDVGYAVKDDGTAWSWGSNQFGLLGDGTTTSRWVWPVPESPVQVIGLSGVKSIGGGSTLAYAVDNNGDLWGWGTSSASAGIPATTNLVPVRLPGTCSGESVFAGIWMDSFEVCADGSVWQLDNNHSRYLNKVAALTAVTSMSASARPTGAQARQSDGTVWRETVPGQWAAIPGLTGIAAVGGDFEYSYAVAAG